MPSHCQAGHIGRVGGWPTAPKSQVQSQRVTKKVTSTLALQGVPCALCTWKIYDLYSLLDSLHHYNTLIIINICSNISTQAQTNGSLWAMDRSTFRKIVLKSAFQKRKMYESFLENVSLLKHLEVIDIVM